MNKKILAFIPLLAGMALSGCDLPFGGSSIDGEFEIVPQLSGGTKAQRTAICTAINDLSPCVNRNTSDLFPDSKITLKQDDGDYIRVTTKQVVGDYTVELKWAADESQASFGSIKQGDAEHQIISVKYPGYKNADTTFKWSLESATCGKAKTKGTIANYEATLVGESHPHDNVTIAEINACNMTEQTIKGHTYPSTYNMINYDQDSPYFAPNANDDNPDYHYIRVRGKVIYYAEDGNWLLLGDGKQVVEIYAGSGKGLVPSNFPAINNGYVEVAGNLSQYKGNIQVGFVTTIDEVEKGNIVDPDVTGTEINAAFITNNFELPSPYKCQRQAIDGFANSIGKISGTVKPNSIKDSGGNSTTAAKVTAAARFTFDVDLAGGKTITVAYDYHTDSTAQLGLFNKLQAKLSGANSISLKGTMRYSAAGASIFQTDTLTSGQWDIVPFAAADVA